MSYFANKIVWITGASSGIGEALTYELTKLGAKIVISARREEELKRVQQQAGPSNVYVLPLDLEAPATFPAKVQEAIGAFEQVDIMIHNGGISQRSKVIDTLPAVQRKVMEVDYFSYIELTRLLLPHMQQRKTGHIAVISSVMGKIGTPMRSAYSAAKHALHGFFDCLRAEVWKDNINVTIITPGYIRTQVSLNAVTASGEKLNELGKNIGHGYAADKTAQQILNAIQKGKFEKYVGRPFSKEWMAIHLMRLFPTLAIKVFKNAVPE
ncbi:SDR family NAD(P)-dependent oxidoreductase [Niastella caeni]|uniref:SDR family NAD(P)-dependent oxidoreductase n=1 Tax=Niastella caeni TaxID=2569763 RepID=A0A4S8I341_9BACT|nr:SDR family NAD(P)-dependent oxidoreductase [Niastella caeni]THU41959.1 SDR family NAD(P)-dependent oxidoreductase [Niastella caeni]